MHVSSFCVRRFCRDYISWKTSDFTYPYSLNKIGSSEGNKDCLESSPRKIGSEWVVNLRSSKLDRDEDQTWNDLASLFSVLVATKHVSRKPKKGALETALASCPQKPSTALGCSTGDDCESFHTFCKASAERAVMYLKHGGNHGNFD